MKLTLSKSKTFFVNHSRQLSSLLIIGIFGFIAFGSNDEEDQKKTQKEVEKAIEEKTEKMESAMEVSAAQIAIDFEKNEIAAEEKYQDKIITVEGVVEDIDKDMFGNYSINLEIPTVQMFNCEFSEDKKSELAALTKGQKIKVIGKFSKTIYLDMDGCSIVKN